MSEFSAQDRDFMHRSLQLAENGLFGAHPNPMVGCVLVHDGEIIAEGWHALAGEAHAEVNAIQAAGDRAKGTVAYVTLEPCSHQGKTPPCCEALIEAGISEVVIAHEDPNPVVNGKGIERLQQAGIAVRSGLLKAEARRLNAGFISRMQLRRPRVQVKIACSLDGRIAMADGESQWITGVESRADVQRLRAQAGAVLTGIGTVLADDPSLTVREASVNPHDRQPLRVILDSRLRLSPDARMLTLPGETLIFHDCEDDGQALASNGAELLRVGSNDGLLELPTVLSALAERGVNDVLVEAGPTIAGQLAQQDLIDEFIIYQAPHILGSETLGMFNTPSWQQLSDRLTLAISDVVRLGNDSRITATREERS